MSNHKTLSRSIFWTINKCLLSVNKHGYLFLVILSNSKTYIQYIFSIPQSPVNVTYRAFKLQNSNIQQIKCRGEVSSDALPAKAMCRISSWNLFWVWRLPRSAEDPFYFNATVNLLAWLNQCHLSLSCYGHNSQYPLVIPQTLIWVSSCHCPMQTLRGKAFLS